LLLIEKQEKNLDESAQKTSPRSVWGVGKEGCAKPQALQIKEKRTEGVPKPATPGGTPEATEIPIKRKKGNIIFSVSKYGKKGGKRGKRAAPFRKTSYGQHSFSRGKRRGGDKKKRGPSLMFEGD